MVDVLRGRRSGRSAAFLALLPALTMAQADRPTAEGMDAPDPATATGAMGGNMPADPVPSGSGSPATEPPTGAPPEGGPSFEYESAFDAYTAFEESEGPDWVGANGRVGEIGGWKTYAREMYETAADGDEPMGEASDDEADQEADDEADQEADR